MTAKTMLSTPFVKILMAALAFGVSASSVEARTVVVVSAHNSVDKLTKTQVADIFLARSNTFPDGTVAVPFDQTDNTIDREVFYREVSGKSPAQLRVYWSKLIFTGRGEPPRELGDAAAVKRTLRETPTGVGYMDDTALDASVKVVLALP